MSEFKPLSIEQIREVLPHRYPFLLIDRVTEMVRPDSPDGNWDGAFVKAIKNVTINEPFFDGHFPNLPVMPGVLIIESMAQTCAMISAHPREDGEKFNFFIGAINDCKFRKPVVPGDQLELICHIKKIRSNTLFFFNCEGHVDGLKVAEASIMAKMF